MDYATAGYSWAIAPGLIALAGLVWLAIALGRRQRRQMLYQHLAAELNLTCTELQDGSLQTEEIREGWRTGLVTEHGVSGRFEGRDITICDRILSMALISASRVTQTVITIEAPVTGRPEFILEPRNWFTRKSELIDHRTNIHIPGDAEFTQHNYITGPDEEAIRALFTKPAMTLLRNNEELMIQGHGDAYVFYHYGDVLSREEILALLRKGLAIVDALHPEPPDSGNSLDP